MAQLKDTLIDGDLKINGKLIVSKENKINFLKLFNIIYPVGSLYWSGVNIDPSNHFPGTEWKAITNSFVYTADTSKAISDTKYGNKEIKLTVDQLPSHHHDISHTHTFKAKGSGNATLTVSSSLTSGGDHAHGKGELYPQGSFEVKKTSWYHSTNIWGQSGMFASENGSHSSRETDQQSKDVNYEKASFSYWLSGRVRGCNLHGHTVYIKGETNFNFTGGNVTTSSISTSSSGDTGKGSSINIMPSYIERYCWERIK